MELHFTPEQEAQLAQVAQHTGKPVEQCLTEAAIAMLHERDAFLGVVQEGIEAADRGEFVEDDEVRRWLEERERSHPQGGRPGTQEGTRELVVLKSPYLAVYRLSGDAVEILRIYHGAQQR